MIGDFGGNTIHAASTTSSTTKSSGDSSSDGGRDEPALRLCTGTAIGARGP